MDRSVLESDPHRVLEGMAIAAYAVGATQGYIYVRAEYPLAVEAAAQTPSSRPEQHGCSGQNIFGTAVQLRHRDPHRAPARSSAARKPR